MFSDLSEGIAASRQDGRQGRHAGRKSRGKKEMEGEEERKGGGLLLAKNPAGALGAYPVAQTL